MSGEALSAEDLPAGNRSSENLAPEAPPPSDPREEQRAVDRAVRALARRDHSAAGLRKKLGRAGLSDAAQASALDVLERAGYVDDARFARDRAAVLAGRGYGDAWIRADLERQEIERDTADAAVAALEDERERALRQAAKAGGGVRAVRSVARRGFSSEALEAVAAAAVADNATEGVGYESSI